MYLDVVKSCPYLFLLCEYCKNGYCDHSAQLLLLVPPKGKSAISIQVVGNRDDCSRSTEIYREQHVRYFKEICYTSDNLGDSGSITCCSITDINLLQIYTFATDINLMVKFRKC